MRLFRMYWQRSLLRPGAILLWLSIPFVFMTIYTLVFGRDPQQTPRTNLALVDQDSSFVSRLVKGAFAQGPIGEMIVVVDAKDLHEVDGLFAREDASAALVIPEGFGDRLLRGVPDSLVLYRNPRHYISPKIAEGVVGSMVTLGNGLLGQFASPMKEVRGSLDRDADPSPDEIANMSKSFYTAGRDARGLAAIRNIDVTVVQKEEDEQENDFNLAALFFPGLVMFGLMSVSLHLEHRFLVDRNRHVTRRIVTAPISPWQVAVQQRLYSASFVYVVGVLAAVVGGLAWRIPAHGLATANLITAALALFVAGINGVIFSLSNSVRAVGAISSMVMIFLNILGGGFFPAEFTPPAFQAIIKWIPTGMANLGLTHCLTGRDAGISVPVLFAYCGAFFAAGIVAGHRRVL
jgi:ABC-type multidrug transport system permease subunit